MGAGYPFYCLAHRRGGEAPRYEQKTVARSVHKELESMSPSRSDIRRQGAEMGIAIRLLTGNAAPKDVEIAALQTVAMKFAEWEGFREMRTGSEYVSGFMQGFRGEAQALLDNPKQ